MSKFNPESAKPREVEAYLRTKVLEYFGNAVENSTTIVSGHGYYSVEIEHDSIAYTMGRFRKKDVPRIVRTLKFLAGGGELERSTVLQSFHQASRCG